MSADVALIEMRRRSARARTHTQCGHALSSQTALRLDWAFWIAGQHDPRCGRPDPRIAEIWKIGQHQSDEIGLRVHREARARTNRKKRSTATPAKKNRPKKRPPATPAQQHRSKNGPPETPCAVTRRTIGQTRAKSIHTCLPCC